MFRQIVSLVTSVAFLAAILVAPASPLLAQEAEVDPASACLEAQHDVETSHSSAGYGFAGFLCGIFGFAFAAVSVPKPPAERLVGKSPEYVAMYSTCYESKAKSKNKRTACIGWAVGAAVAVGFYLISDTDSN